MLVIVMLSCLTDLQIIKEVIEIADVLTGKWKVS